MFDRLFGRDDPLKETAVYRTDRSYGAFRDALLDEVPELRQRGYSMVTERGTSTTLRYDGDIPVSVLHDRYGQRGPENRIEITVRADSKNQIEAMEEAYDTVTDAASTLIDEE